MYLIVNYSGNQVFTSCIDHYATSKCFCRNFACEDTGNFTAVDQDAASLLLSLIDNHGVGDQLLFQCLIIVGKIDNSQLNLIRNVRNISGIFVMLIAKNKSLNGSRFFILRNSHIQIPFIIPPFT